MTVLKSARDGVVGCALCAVSLFLACNHNTDNAITETGSGSSTGGGSAGDGLEGAMEACASVPADITSDTRLPAGCYDITNSVLVRGGATLTLDPGVTLQFRAGTGMTIRSDGRLSAVGSADAPILLTGAEPQRGFWNGLRLDSSNSPLNRLEYVTFEYGGGFWNGTLFVDGTVSSPGRLTVKHCTLRDSATHGFYFDEDTVLDEFSDNVVTANAAGPGSLTAEELGYLDSGSTYSGNDADVLEVRGAIVNRAQTWSALDVPYRVLGGVRLSAALAIEPGVELFFTQGGALTVSNTGSLAAVGTAASPIRMAGDEPGRGLWAGLRFDASNSSANQLEYVIIEQGGGSSSGNLVLDGSAATPARATVRNCTFSDGDQLGFYFDKDVIIEAFTGNTATANALGAGSVSADLAAALDGSGVYAGNDREGVEVRGGEMVGDGTWATLGVPWRVTGDVEIKAAWTLAPGVELVFAAGRELTVQTSGSLDAAGNAALGILLTGEQAAPGYWGGVRLAGSDARDNRLEYVTIEYGGGVWNGNLFVDGGGGKPARVEVHSSTFRGSGSWGMYLNAEATVNGDLETVNTFVDNVSGKVRMP